ncbi:hypothetical protein [Micromonospora globbae]|uniref:hypothetical protein n=1 Tax=Micromonospora globbae TaxID=1894969 RepID=UPI0037AE790F
MTQSPTGPQGYPPPHPAQPPAAPGQPPSPEQSWQRPTATYGTPRPAPPEAPTQPLASAQPGAPVPPTGPAQPYAAPPTQPTPPYAAQPAPPFSAPPAQPAPPHSAPPAPPFSAPSAQPTQPFSAPPTPPFSAPPAAAGYASPAGHVSPASVPPYVGPVSGPPVPGVDQPMSVPPAGAYPGAPMSAPPGAVPPYGPAGATGGRGRTVLILAVVAGLFFVLGGVMTGLYLTKSSELDRTERRLTAQVSERDGTIAANAKEIDKLKTDLQTVRDRLADTEQDLTGTRNDRDEQARQKKVIANCLDKLTTALGAAAAGDKGAYDKAMQGLDKVCDEAENYL